MSSIAAFAGMAAVAGLLLLISGGRRVPVRPKEERASERRRQPPPPERIAYIAISSIGVLIMTRWPVAAVGTAIAVGFAAAAIEKGRTRVSSGDRAEAIATWAEMLRDATGTPRGIEGVLVATASTAPDLIKPHVKALAERVAYEPLDTALDSLAKDLDHPLGDLVVTALRLSASTGGRQIRGVLNDLVIVAREEARMHTRVTVARARPRSQMRILCIMIALFVSGMVLFARGFLEPFGTVLGQTVLIVIGCCWALAVWLMAQLGRESVIERFLASDSSAGLALAHAGDDEARYSDLGELR